MVRSSILTWAVGIALTLMAGCDRGIGNVPAPEPPVVPYALPVQDDVTEYVDYTGRTNAKDSVTVVPRVTGYLITRDKDGKETDTFPFKEGADVKKGDLLFEIDPRPYQAQLNAAEAQRKINEANLNYQTATNLRFKKLYEKDKNAVSERELDQYQAQEDQAAASLKLAVANLDAAKLNLEWTKVTAPISGRISRYFLTPGNLVNQDVTQLTTVVSADPIYVYFDMDEPTLISIRQAINEGRLPRAKENEAPVHMALAGEAGFPHHGTINFIDNQVNPGTGSISVRGVFPNPRPKGGTNLIVPGMFVRVRLPIGKAQSRLLVFDSAVTSVQEQKKVFVIDADNKVQDRTVTLGSLQDNGQRVILQGLQKDDKVLIGALQQIRPRMLVSPEGPYSMPSVGHPPVLKK